MVQKGRIYRRGYRRNSMELLSVVSIQGVILPKIFTFHILLNSTKILYVVTLRSVFLQESHITFQHTVPPDEIYRVCINYRRISLHHNLNTKCRKIVKFVSITHSESNIWNGPIVATAISREKRKPVLEGNGCTWPPRSPEPDSV